MRWTPIRMLAAAVLAVTRARTTNPADPVRLVVVSAREQVRLLRATVLPQPRRDLAHLQHWSAWRRHHRYQAAARAHHRWNNIIATATT
jgi:hypothetical protein